MVDFLTLDRLRLYVLRDQSRWYVVDGSTEEPECNWPGDLVSEHGTEAEARAALKRLTEWVGVDLDGTLAEHRGWTAVDVIGAPVPRMVERVRAWLAEGREVRIVTARVAAENFKCIVTGRPWSRAAVTLVIENWLVDAAKLPRLKVTCQKDHAMSELWDDRAVQVVPNTGMTIDEERNALRDALARLSSEVLGSLPLMEPLARREFGNSNYALLIQRAEEARALVRESA